MNIPFGTCFGGVKRKTTLQGHPKQVYIFTNMKLMNYRANIHEYFFKLRHFYVHE